MLITTNNSTSTWPAADIFGCKTFILHCFGMKLCTNWSFSTSPSLTSSPPRQFQLFTDGKCWSDEPDAWEEARGFKVSLQMFQIKRNSTMSNVWPNMFVILKSEPVFACFILRGTKHSHVPKLMKHFHINVPQRRISSNFDLSLILNQEAFCVLELWHGSTLFLCSISSYLTTRSPPEWC